MNQKVRKKMKNRIKYGLHMDANWFPVIEQSTNFNVFLGKLSENKLVIVVVFGPNQGWLSATVHQIFVGNNTGLSKGQAN